MKDMLLLADFILILWIGNKVGLSGWVTYANPASVSATKASPPT